MCQQAVEKALKACIAKTDDFPPKTHDLPRLARLGGLIGLMDEGQKLLLEKLYPLNVEARYR
jgi:HEPN domain-containing protein